MIQEVRKIIKKGLRDTNKIMMQLNHMERQGSDWGEYLRNGPYLFVQESPEMESIS